MVRCGEDTRRINEHAAVCRKMDCTHKMMMMNTSYAMISSGISWNIERETCFFFIKGSCVCTEKQASRACFYIFGTIEGVPTISDSFFFTIFGYCYNVICKFVINFWIFRIFTKTRDNLPKVFRKFLMIVWGSFCRRLSRTSKDKPGRCEDVSTIAHLHFCSEH